MRGSINHFLKIHPQYFDDVCTGKKSFEIRSTEDRNFQEGDTLTLQEWDPAKMATMVGAFGDPESPAHKAAVAKAYTGREVVVKVTYLLAGGVTWQGKPAAVMGIQHDLFQEGL